MRIRRLVPLSLVLSLLALAGCRDREITAYRAPKEATPPMPPAQTSRELPADHPPIGDNARTPGADMANTAVPTANGDELIWTAPARWTAKPLSPMRKGSFAVKGEDGEADFSITAFPGDTGGIHANLNRWRNQIGLASVSPAELDAALQHIDGQGLHFDCIDLAGTVNGTPQRILGAILSRPGETWFFKLAGPDALVAGQKSAFMEFLQTVKEAR